MNKHHSSAAQKTSSQQIFFLPELCRAEALLGLILLAELLVFVLVLADPASTELNWSRLSLTSFFVQWVLLLTVALLCRMRPWFVHASVLTTSALTCLLCLAVTLACTALTLWLNLFPYANTPSWPLYLRHGLISLIMSAIVLRVLYLQSESRHQQQARLQAKLQALQARIRPHFLYNSLNSIASLTATAPDKAEQAILDLSQLLRATLAETGDISTWQAEHALALRYLSLEQYRFGPRLQVQWNCDGIPDQLPMPHLSLQPLLENAVLHGIQPRLEGGTIQVSAWLEHHHFHLEVRNPLPAQPTPNRGSGIALYNIRTRLQVLFGAAAQLQAGRQADAFVTKIQYPWDTPAAVDQAKKTQGAASNQSPPA